MVKVFFINHHNDFMLYQIQKKYLVILISYHFKLYLMA